MLDFVDKDSTIKISQNKLLRKSFRNNKAKVKLNRTFCQKKINKKNRVKKQIKAQIYH